MEELAPSFVKSLLIAKALFPFGNLTGQERIPHIFKENNITSHVSRCFSVNNPLIRKRMVTKRFLIGRIIVTGSEIV